MMCPRPSVSPTLVIVLWAFALQFANGCSSDDVREDELQFDPSPRTKRIIEESQHPLATQVSRRNLVAHLDALTRGPRNAGSSDLEASRQYCESQLEGFGFEVQRTTVDGSDSINVVGTRLGSLQPDTQVILSAHIDSVPECQGADDNATGVAGMLEAARLLAKRDHSSTLVAACWDGEEQSLAGSMQYAADQQERGVEIRVAFVLEMIGYTSSEPNSQRLPVSAENEPLFSLLFPDAYADFVAHDRRGDFIALVYDAAGSITPAGASSAADAFVSAAYGDLRTSVLPLTTAIAGLLPDTTRSDHAAFWRNGYSALMITDTANLRNPNYHCQNGDDSITTIDPAFVARVIRATVSAVVRELER
jgi:Zn-dependent M28 family amino/carboxypeptidase